MIHDNQCGLYCSCPTCKGIRARVNDSDSNDVRCGTYAELCVDHEKRNSEANSEDFDASVELFGSGSKYLRQINFASGLCVDVYSVLEAFDVRCPARQHAIKKLLCAGIRGKNNETQDLVEACDAVKRAIAMQKLRV